MPLSIVEGASLAQLNSFGVEQRAARLVRVSRTEDLPAALQLMADAPARLVLGAGSNLLFTRDFEGTVLQLCTRGRRVLDESRHETLVEAEGGEPWDGFVRWTLEHGLGGLENLSLIPGLVGASPIQNIGAYGVEMREHFAGLTALDLDSGQPRDFAPQDCAFGYRDSVFRHPQGRRWLVVRVRFRLSRQPQLRLDYGEIRQELARAGCERPGPADVARIVRAIRRRKLPDPARIGNAGSFFKNPLVEPALAQTLAASHPDMPSWPAGERVKLSAAWLIERCGWKGAREGDAGVHAAHALVLVNHGRASGAQILALAGRIRDSVVRRFGVELEPEPLVL